MTEFLISCLHLVTVDETVEWVACVWSWGARAFPHAQFSGLVKMGDWAKKTKQKKTKEKCASLNDVSLTRLFWLQKQNWFILSLTKQVFSYNMRDPIWGGKKLKKEQKSRAIKMTNSAANLISIFFSPALLFIYRHSRFSMEQLVQPFYRHLNMME